MAARTPLRDADGRIEGEGDKEGGKGVHGEKVGLLDGQDGGGPQESRQEPHAIIVEATADGE